MRCFRHLRRFRIAIAVLASFGFFAVFTGAALLLLPSHTQAFPAALRLFTAFSPAAAGLAAVIILVTLLVGRVYCSLLCPLGLCQDAVYAVSRKLVRRRPQKNYRCFRYLLTGLLLLCFLAGASLPLTLLEPFSFFGRIGNTLWRPAAVWISQQLWSLTRWQLFSPLEYHPWSGALVLGMGFFAVGLILLVVLRGRLFCHTLCPVGAVLGVLARFSFWQLRLDGDKCVRCRRCEKRCKSGCIDIDRLELDFERCVMCFDCAAGCRFGAAALVRRRPPPTATDAGVPDPSRRKFFASAGAGAAAAGTALLLRSRQKQPERVMPPMPPGAGDFARFTALCTGCQLCAAVCPGKTIKPAGLEYGLGGMGQARLEFDIGKCEFDCVRCTEVCPTGALRKLGMKEKQLTRIGLATYERSRCVVVTERKDCGACAEHCPTGALEMVEYEDGLRIPHLIPELCIGCGSCEYICPVRPLRATLVAGLRRHEPALDPEDYQEETLPAPSPPPAAGDKSYEFPF